MMSPRGCVYLLCVSLLACLSNANTNACDAPQESGLNDACGQSIERSSPDGVRSVTHATDATRVSPCRRGLDSGVRCVATPLRGPDLCCSDSSGFV